jgi:hypothetical protein
VLRRPIETARVTGHLVPGLQMLMYLYLGIKGSDLIRRLCSGGPDAENAAVEKQFVNET